MPASLRRHWRNGPNKDSARVIKDDSPEDTLKSVCGPLTGMASSTATGAGRGTTGQVLEFALGEEADAVVGVVKREDDLVIRVDPRAVHGG